MDKIVWCKEQKQGLKKVHSCEIHDCTIAVFSELCGDADLVEELRLSKEHRIRLQYYVVPDFDSGTLLKNAKKAFSFVVSLENLLEKNIDFSIPLQQLFENT